MTAMQHAPQLLRPPVPERRPPAARAAAPAIGAPLPALLRLQHTHGNQFVQRFLVQRCGGTVHAGCSCAGGAHDAAEQAPPIQAKLAVNRPGDAYEQEADRVAEAVLGTAEPRVARQWAAPLPIQRRCSSCDDDVQRKGADGQACESAGGLDWLPELSMGDEQGEGEEETEVMAKASGAALPAGPPDLEGRIARAIGGGSPLAEVPRSFMEARFGHDFGDVRLHTDGEAAELARSLEAEAFTTGSDIFFQSGRHDPDTNTGRRLLAHELTHVVQQRSTPRIARAPAADGGADDLLLQRYSLKNFSATDEAAMHAAIPVASSTVRSCSALKSGTRNRIANAIDSKRYDFDNESDICGWTFPASWYIEIGPKAFNPSRCCKLESTVAHEASHTQFFTEGKARKLESDCFGC